VIYYQDFLEYEQSGNPYLRYNKIKQLNRSLFSGLRAFNGLTKLTKHFMWRNDICDILPGTFENMSILVNLDLNYNKIKQLNRSLFSGLRAFNGHTKLTKHFMLHKEISDILPGTFENMSSLKYLDLRFNTIEHLDSAVFSGLFKLKYLFLSENQLQYIHPQTFLALPNIKCLNIKENRALHKPTDIIPTIHFLFRNLI
jgi:Leucine-rich repeat (LRR) protein